MQLKPENEIIVAATSVALVLAIFSQATPNLADVRFDKPGNVNTHKAVKLAAITATAVVGSLSLLSGSPTVFVIGGGMILAETWKYHFANYAADGHQDNSVQEAQNRY